MLFPVIIASNKVLWKPIQSSLYIVFICLTVNLVVSVVLSLSTLKQVKNKASQDSQVKDNGTCLFSLVSALPKASWGLVCQTITRWEGGDYLGCISLFHAYVGVSTVTDLSLLQHLLKLKTHTHILSVYWGHTYSTCTQRAAAVQKHSVHWLLQCL